MAPNAPLTILGGGIFAAFGWRLNRPQGRIKTKLGLMLLPGKESIFFSAFKTDQEVQDPWLLTQTTHY